MSLVVPGNIPAGSVTTLTIPGVANTASVGAHTLSVWTSSDHVVVTLPYQLLSAVKKAVVVTKAKARTRRQGPQDQLHRLLPSHAPRSLAASGGRGRQRGHNCRTAAFPYVPGQSVANQTFVENYADISAWWRKWSLVFAPERARRRIRVAFARRPQLGGYVAPAGPGARGRAGRRGRAQRAGLWCCRHRRVAARGPFASRVRSQSAHADQLHRHGTGHAGGSLGVRARHWHLPPCPPSRQRASQTARPTPGTAGGRGGCVAVSRATGF